MPDMALVVISRVLAASISSGDISEASVAFCPIPSWSRGPFGPPFMPGLLPLPAMPGPGCEPCCETIAATLANMGRSSTMTRDCR